MSQHELSLTQDTLGALVRMHRVARGLTCAEAQAIIGRLEIVLVDLRDKAERDRHGEIPGSVHAPYPELEQNVGPGGLLHELARAAGKRLVFYCAFGERSAMAVEAAQEAGLTNTCHIKGGLDAWNKTGGPLAGAGRNAQTTARTSTTSGM